MAIARAAVANSPVQDGMDVLMTGRTTFVIAHRLSTVKKHGDAAKRNVSVLF